MTDKYLVNCAYGTDNPEKATIAFILAFASSKSAETAVFATAGAASLFCEDSAPNIVCAAKHPYLNRGYNYFNVLTYQATHSTVTMHRNHRPC
jgi:predicted peroxiredoxin